MPEISRYKMAKRTLFLTSLVSLFLILSLALSSCGGGATVNIGDLMLDPDTITIKAGETVTWKNEDRRSHQIMSGLPPVMTDEYMSPVLEPGESWTHTFEKPGEYAYHDMKVPGLVGWINVEE